MHHAGTALCHHKGPMAARKHNEIAVMMVGRRPQRAKLNRRLVAATVLTITTGYFLIATNLLTQQHRHDESSKHRRNTQWLAPPDKAHEIQQQPIQNAEEISSVDYMACCGAGASSLAERSMHAQYSLQYRSPYHKIGRSQLSCPPHLGVWTTCILGVLRHFRDKTTADRSLSVRSRFGSDYVLTMSR